MTRSSKMHTLPPSLPDFKKSCPTPPFIPTPHTIRDSRVCGIQFWALSGVGGRQKIFRWGPNSWVLNVNGFPYPGDKNLTEVPKLNRGWACDEILIKSPKILHRVRLEFEKNVEFELRPEKNIIRKMTNNGQSGQMIVSLKFSLNFHPVSSVYLFRWARFQIGFSIQKCGSGNPNDCNFRFNIRDMMNCCHISRSRWLTQQWVLWETKTETKVSESPFCQFDILVRAK